MGQDAFERVIAGNSSYRARCSADAPALWSTLDKGQAPEVLWFGCGDSRVPETTICDCQPGDMFVHRNIANLLVPGDLSSESVVDFAVGAVQVKKVILCGHTRCGGAINALADKDLGHALNTWLTPLRALRKKHQQELDALPDDDARATRLAELNVLMGLDTLRKNPMIQKHIADRGLALHGLIFDIASGALRPVEEARKVEPVSVGGGAWQHR